jgi:energy-converting hydrogenase B subunit D
LNWAFNLILITLLITTALGATIARDLLAAVIIFSSYSMIMALLWQRLQAPDLALAEAAVGAGITTVLFIITIFKTGRGKRAEERTGKGEREGEEAE